MPRRLDRMGGWASPHLVALPARTTPVGNPRSHVSGGPSPRTV